VKDRNKLGIDEVLLLTQNYECKAYGLF